MTFKWNEIPQREHIRRGYDKSLPARFVYIQKKKTFKYTGDVKTYIHKYIDTCLVKCLLFNFQFQVQTCNIFILCKYFLKLYISRA